jgi:uncharacterized membrane protein
VTSLFVLSAFFNAVAGLTAIRFMIALIAGLVTARFTTSVGFSSRRMLTRNFTGTLFHALISRSIVGHMNPPHVLVSLTSSRPSMFIGSPFSRSHGWRDC